MRMIKFTKTPKVNGHRITTPPIYVRRDVSLPVVGEGVGASSDSCDTVLMGEVIEVNESTRTYVARFSAVSWESGKKNAALGL